MGRVLLLAEHDNMALNEATLRSVTAALQIGDVDILVAGDNCADVASAASQIRGVGKVLLAQGEVFEHQLAESVADLILELAEPYETIVAPATTSGKNILPRVAALLDVAQISEIVEIVSKDTFIRPVYAGNALQKLRSNETKKVITIRYSSFDMAETGSGVPVENVDSSVANSKSAFISEAKSQSDQVDLVSARVIVSGGRAFGSKEKFDELLRPLAARLNAAIGASRAAVDAGFSPNDTQVGQTGKVVAPDLYIAIGISGAIQHLAGMKESKVIVAINSDEDAPIHANADYVLIADLFDAVPELTAKL
ncbi:MAG: electron transfer flavoprotein subunit alpha/FixB family protein [Devosiaceae bacterium]|nr:electron transfer flavoprotein subunit alpha/FixB family protein [Devosiaceae bacterium]